MRTEKAPSSHPYRIGAISSHTGIPVTTLRIWETRYGAFAPVKTEGGHRLYSADDMRKAQLFKQLGAQGHAISSIAGLDASALWSLLQSAPTAAPAPGAVAFQRPAPRSPLHLAVVGSALATRLQSAPLAQALPQHTPTLTERFADLRALQDAGLQQAPQLLLIRASTLHEPEVEQLLHCVQQHAPVPVLLLYTYAPERLLQRLRSAGLALRREPLSDHELAAAILALLQAPTSRSDSAAAMPQVPPRKYSEEVLARVSALSTQLRCECPRHVADILAQLAHFETYSQECLNKSAADARLHAYLAWVAGSARALFEDALEQVAWHEGIALAEVAR